MSVRSEDKGILPSDVQRRQGLILDVGRHLGIADRLNTTSRPPERYLPDHPDRLGRALRLAGSTPTWVAYQFDGISHPHLNPTDTEIEHFLRPFPGTSLQKLGLPRLLDDCVEILRHAKCFVGVSSGMSHIAASFGIPSFIFRKPQPAWRDELRVRMHLRRWNPYPGTVFFSTADELERLVARL